MAKDETKAAVPTPPEGEVKTPAPVVKEKVEKEDKKKTVEIDAATLEKLLTGFENAQKTIADFTEKDKKRDAEIEMLKSISDKGRLAHYQQQTSKDGILIRNAKVGMWEGKPIIAWQKVKDEVGFNNLSGAMVVNQVIKLFLDTGKKEPEEVEVDYLFWAQNTSCDEGEVVETRNTSNGTYWTVQMKDGRQITLDIRFVNPF